MRRSPLKRKTPLRSYTRLKTKTPLRGISEKEKEARRTLARNKRVAWQREGFKCLLHGETPNYTEHIIRKALLPRDVKNDPRNLTPGCERCKRELNGIGYKQVQKKLIRILLDKHPELVDFYHAWAAHLLEGGGNERRYENLL